MNNKDILSNYLESNSVRVLSTEELINLDGGDVSQFTEGVLVAYGNFLGHMHNAWDYYKKAVLAKAASEHHLF
jgi:hypothetical protein